MMKNLKRALALTLLLVALGGVAIPNVVFMQSTKAIAEDGGISTRADIIDWRFSTIDGRMHRRLYNYSRSCWIGEWIPC